MLIILSETKRIKIKIKIYCSVKFSFLNLSVPLREETKKEKLSSEITFEKWSKNECSLQCNVDQRNPLLIQCTQRREADPSQNATNGWQQQIQFPFGFLCFFHHSNRNRFLFISIGFYRYHSVFICIHCLHFSNRCWCWLVFWLLLSTHLQWQRVWTC